jgi:regulator of protease activity HflC (stomatin/prohibitin superfamily)
VIADQASVQVIETCGRFSRIAQPGFNCVLCCVGEAVAGSMSLRIQQIDCRCETKTKDNVFVEINVSVQYQIMRDNLMDAFYKLTDSRAQITAFVFDEVRATVPRIELDQVFVSKEEIAASIKDELTKSMSGFGYAILNVLVTDIEPAAKVKAAMNEINAAQRLRLAAYEQSEAEKIRVVKAAEADAEAKYLAGQGIARQRQAIMTGLRESVQSFQSEVTEINSKDVLSLMLLTQYFDAVKEIGMSSKSSTIFIPSNPGAVSDLATEIRNGVLQAGAAQTMRR